jgi:hypothetical protein
MADIAAILAIPAILTMISTTMPRSKLLLSIVVALVVALGLGYAWGASGRFSIQNALDDARQQLDLAQARGALLEARVSVYNVNFGDAARHFEEAKAPLRRVRERYQQVGKNAAAGSVTAALEHIDEGQRLAGKLDQAANNKANDALEAIKVASSQ